MIAGRLHWKPPGAKVPGKVGLAAFDFPSGTLVLTEASTRKRASIHVVRGDEGVAQILQPVLLRGIGIQCGVDLLHGVQDRAPIIEQLGAALHLKVANAACPGIPAASQRPGSPVQDFGRYSSRSISACPRGAA